MIIDTHAHYDDKQFQTDREELLSTFPEQGIEAVVNASATVASWDKVLEMTRKYPWMYGMIGVHPDEVGDLNEENFARMETLLGEEKIVAVGEIGLDYYWDKEAHEIQKEWFIRQLQLAQKLQMPINIHSREAAADTMDVIRSHAQGLSGIIHCYSYSPEQAAEYVKMGFAIGIGGVVTFKNAKKLKQVAEETPLTSIVLETDCPYLAPEPNRGKRNSSLNLPYVAAEIGRLKGVTAEEVIEQTAENAKRIYRM